MKARLLLRISLFLTSVLMVGCASTPPAFNQAAIATSHPLATQAGFRALDQGGNAYDAAVAASAVLSVVAPYGAGLGGGSVWLLQRKDSEATVVDAREAAPQNTHQYSALYSQPLERPDQNTQQTSDSNPTSLPKNSPKSAAIPGQPAALAHISRKYAIRPLAANLADAVHIATRGFRANKQYRDYATKRLDALKQQPSSPFLHQGGIPGSRTIIKQPALAATLKQLGRKGHKGFYQGEVANNIIADLKQAGVIWSLQDLNNYNVIERTPISFGYKGSTITTTPPPSYAGITLQQTLKILERFDTSEMSRVEKIDLVSRIMRVTTPEITHWLGDPDFSNLPLEKQSSASYLSFLAADIAEKVPTKLNKDAANTLSPSDAFMPQIVAVDKWGNRVAVSLSMNEPFGSTFTSRSTGVLLNNSLTSFSNNPHSNNTAEPGKRPLSYMNPILAESSDEFTIMAASKGKYTNTALLLAILDYIDKSNNNQAHSIAYHYDTLNEQLLVDLSALSDAEKHTLKEMGHRIQAYPTGHSDLQVIHKDKATGNIEAYSSSTGGGQAVVR
ncbi:gamma-glutamyltransferase [Alkalimarinus sediminis]|uniref:Gamma-glutamyltransferase n=2 Tax=Alkalimarinus sediminis TaxID=1632866 RepID=A0A9E8HGE4_9ALTE|nr:gamma-glutamyltransferase [Alkalimarinus sediminis]UZW73944.1 gamma-glutamyltransferase [Alkalimarinus sediminis]